MADSAYLDLARVHRAGLRAVLATVVRSEGPSYRPVGSSAVIVEDGRSLGAVSGGCLQSDIAESARRLFAGGPPCLLDYDTGSSEDLAWGTGSGCGGRISVLVAPVAGDLLAAVTARLEAGEAVGVETVITPGPDLGRQRLLDHLPVGTVTICHGDIMSLCQIVTPPTPLLLCGAGDDAQPLATLAAACGFAVTVVDHRPALRTPERFPAARALVCDPPPVRAGGYAVFITHDYQRDLDLLSQLLPQPLAYVGLLGSRKRSARLVDELLSGAPELAESARTRLHAPVGLDIGADGPQEIAVSVVAELVAHRAGRGGGPLRG